MNNYSLPEPLLQDLVRVIEQLPAGQVRHILNAVEAECMRQDKARAAEAAEAQKAEMRKQIEAESKAAEAPPA